MEVTPQGLNLDGSDPDFRDEALVTPEPSTKSERLLGGSCSWDRAGYAMCVRLNLV
jgi:hypothetical protein